jgi:hypothetical protein
MAKYLDSENLEIFIKGKYDGETAQDVVDDDPEYVESLLQGEGLDADEREVLSTLYNEWASFQP